MSSYEEHQKEEDQRSVANALQHLDSLRETFKDVIALPNVITLLDVCNLVMNTPRGPVKLSSIASRDELVAVLHALEENPCTPDPEQVAYYAIKEYREQHPSTRKS